MTRPIPNRQRNAPTAETPSSSLAVSHAGASRAVVARPAGVMLGLMLTFSRRGAAL